MELGIVLDKAGLDCQWQDSSMRSATPTETESKRSGLRKPRARR